jgi:hypothetical protein
MCVCPSVISSIFAKSFHFPFPYFVLETFMLDFNIILFSVASVRVKTSVLGEDNEER